MIDKITPRFLDKSSDEKLVKKTSFIDALNLYIDDVDGDGGVLKPIKGTQPVSAAPGLSTDPTKDYIVLGSVSDENTGIVYLFVGCSDINEHGVYAYDSRGVLPSPDGNGGFNAPIKGSYLKILTAPEFNFPMNGFVKGDIVYSNTREFDKHDLPGVSANYPEKDALLYFTDNKNEPRKINVYRALLSGFQLVGPDSLENRQIKRDFICACPRVPLEEITFEFKRDQDRDVNNFDTAPGFQFAYQNIYKDGLESAISPYSRIAFPPSIVNRGASTSDTSFNHNMCVLTVPPQNQEVESVRILARYGNGTNFIELDEIDNEAPGESISYKFYNDRIAGGVSPQTVDKTFDNVPQKAQAQAISSNRLAYGNYVEGYDNVDCSGVKLEPVYKDRPAEIIDYQLLIKPSIERSAGGTDLTENKTIGFSYTASQFADKIAANTKVNISFSISPDKNFHVYTTYGEEAASGDRSYHQSRQVGANSLNLPGYGTQNNGVITPDSPAYLQEEGAAGEPGFQNEIGAGGRFLHMHRENYFGFNKGVGGQASSIANPASTDTYWKQEVPTNFSPFIGNKRLFFGTSAGNPLILSGGACPFSVSFTINNEVSTGGGAVVADIFSKILEGKTQEQISQELGFSSGFLTVHDEDTKITHSHFINLGLQDYDEIPVGTSISDLITGAAYGGDVVSPNLENLLKNKPPSCAFIVNKAEVKFYLERVSDTENGEYRAGKNRAFRLCIENVYLPDDDPNDIMTCVRDLDPASPWWAISRGTISDPAFLTNFVQIYNSELTFSGRIFRQMSPNDVLAATRNFSTEFAFDYDVDDEGNPIEDSGALIGQGGQGDGSGPKPIMEMCFGSLQVGVDVNAESGRKKKLLKNTSDGSFNNRFQFSLMDGEGGPGGSGAGQGSGYDVLACDKYGSIAGQCFIEYDKDNLFCMPQSGFVRYIAGLDGDGTISTIGNASLQYVQNNEIANQIGLTQYDIEGEVIGYLHTSILCGPFYTGRIVMNAVDGGSTNEENEQLGNVNPGPIATDMSMTTTLPLIYWSSWTLDVNQNNYSGVFIPSQFSAGDLFGGTTALPEVQTSYPYPIVQTAEDGGGGFENGSLEGGTLKENPFGNEFGSVDFERLHSHGEIVSPITSVEDPSIGSGMSFKSGANHEFGIVYYDERGRHGYVNPIGSVYVKNYGDRNNGEKGAAYIKATDITHTPPSWAKRYKLVYSKNTSVDKFIQYSSGGAFIPQSENNSSGSRNIYVSLNYLQGHPISYSNSFGARGKDGTPVMYSFTPGDRLKVISYMLYQDGANISRVFPVSYEFEVAGLTSLTALDNPLAEVIDAVPETEPDAPQSKTGLFLLLKNNEDANGFRYQDVEQGNDNWGNNCIFEIYSPSKELQPDERLYYEIGESHKVLTILEDGIPTRIHENSEVLLTQGDVFFRSHAVNLRDFDSTQGFVDLLIDVNDNGEPIVPESNFKSYYLESEAASDLFPSRAISIGRPNIVKLDARRSRKEVSIVHSDRDIPGSSKIGYSSFNRSIPSETEVDYKGGEINYLCNHQDAIFFVQRNKCGHIPVDRNLISDASGSSTLITSSKFLGSPRYYAGTAGCDGNPESVVDVDNTAYFAHKSFGKVFKVSGVNGVNVISDAGMSSFFRDEFNNALNSSDPIRVVGGYDPVKKEYLLTTLNKPTINTGSQSFLFDTVAPADDVEVTDIGGAEEDLIPKISVDWSAPSNLSSVQFITYFNNGGNSINNELSVWKSGAETNFQAIDLSLRVTVENAGSLNEAATISFAIDGNSTWSFIEGDVTNFDSVLQNLEAAGYPNESESDHYSFNFKNLQGSNDVVSSQDAAPVSLTLDLNQVSMGNPSADETFVFDMPIRYICENENPHTPITNLKALNQGGILNGVTQSSLMISAEGGQVYVGSTDQLIGAETIVPLNGQAIWLPLPPTEGPTGDEEADDTGGGGGDVGGGGGGVITDFGEDTQAGGGGTGGGGGITGDEGK